MKSRQTKWKNKKYDELNCVHCGKPLEEDNLGIFCIPCKKRHRTLQVYRRYFYGLFT